MLDLFRTLIETYGPTWGPALFVGLFVVALLITRIERRVYLHGVRLNLALLDKDLFSYDELRKYQLIDESFPTLEVMK